LKRQNCDFEPELEIHFTTDTAAVLRGVEINADVILKEPRRWCLF
jgi:hypothetical protein